MDNFVLKGPNKMAGNERKSNIRKMGLKMSNIFGQKSPKIWGSFNVSEMYEQRENNFLKKIVV